MIPGMVQWVAQRLAEAKEEERTGILGLWVHPKRQPEISQQTAEELNELSDEDVVDALHELRQPKKIIRGKGGNQMKIPIHLQTLDGNQNFRTDTLLDSGSTGSCINEKFVKENNIPTRKMARPMPTYNADGTLNSGGAVSEFVQMKMVIQDHVERIDFAVTNLGSKTAFIGHDWLKRHNPTINWRMATLLFDKCPRDCEYIHSLEDLEHWEQDQQEIMEKIPLDKGDKLYSFDVNAYMMHDKDKEEEEALEDKVFREKIPKHYHEYKDVFDKRDFDQLPER